jgi:hypothetical protein
MSQLFIELPSLEAHQLLQAKPRSMDARIVRNPGSNVVGLAILDGDGVKELVRLHPTLAPFFTRPDVTFPLFSIVNGMSQLVYTDQPRPPPIIKIISRDQLTAGCRRNSS